MIAAIESLLIQNDKADDRVDQLPEDSGRIVFDQQPEEAGVEKVGQACELCEEIRNFTRSRYEKNIVP